MTKEELIKLSRKNLKKSKQDSLCKCYDEAFIKGYELSKKRIAELEAQIEKMKWHKVADGDLPKDRHNVYVVYLNGYYQLQKTIASFRHKYWVFNGLKTECEIIAWCELPKWEIKEK